MYSFDSSCKHEVSYRCGGLLVYVWYQTANISFCMYVHGILEIFSDGTAALIIKSAK